MKFSSALRFTLSILALASVGLGLSFAGPSAPPAPRGDGKGTDEGPDAAKLWAQNCTRCHNQRPAKEYSDAQWDAIMHHMRVRGNLTGGDARLIAEFLKGAN